jgi:hypothetical protein
LRSAFVRRRAFAVCVGVALLLHAPFIPNNLFVWLGMLDSQVGLGDLEGEAIIPIDLEFDLSEGAAAPAAVAAPEPTGVAVEPLAELPKPKPKPKPKPPEVGDAGVEAGVDAAVEAGADAGTELDAGEDPYADDKPDAGAVAQVARDADVDAAEAVGVAPDAGPDETSDAGVLRPVEGVAQLRDPASAAGDASKIAGKNPNVQVLIASDRLREHDLGATFGKLLTSLPEWAAFFDGTGIDPVRDLDHVLLAGPQFRNFRKVVAVMDYNVSSKRVREAMAVVVQRSAGTWVEPSPFPAARITPAFDHGARILAHVPQRRLLVLLPEDAEDQLSKLKSMKGFAKSPVGILVSIVTPARAFRGLPFTLPSSLKVLRLSVTPKPEGAAEVSLELLDGSPEEARVHAPELTRAVDAIRVLDLGLFKKTFIDHLELVADGAMIRGTLTITPRQLRFMLDELEQLVAMHARR